MTIQLKSDDDAVSLQFEIANILRSEVGLHERYATVLAEPIVNGLRKRFRGENIYIGNSSKAERAERDEAIRKAFNGTNLDDVCKQFNVSKNTVYRAAHSKSGVA